jgi:hypothetical protein
MHAHGKQRLQENYAQLIRATCHSLWLNLAVPPTSRSATKSFPLLFLLKALLSPRVASSRLHGILQRAFRAEVAVVALVASAAA